MSLNFCLFNSIGPVADEYFSEFVEDEEGFDSFLVDDDDDPDDDSVPFFLPGGDPSRSVSKFSALVQAKSTISFAFLCSL